MATSAYGAGRRARQDGDACSGVSTWGRPEGWPEARYPSDRANFLRQRLVSAPASLTANGSVIGSGGKYAAFYDSRG